MEDERMMLPVDYHAPVRPSSAFCHRCGQAMGGLVWRDGRFEHRAACADVRGETEGAWR